MKFIKDLIRCICIMSLLITLAVFALLLFGSNEMIEVFTNSEKICKFIAINMCVGSLLSLLYILIRR